MSSVSRSSRISAKSQVIIAAQDGQIAAMRAAMIAAGLDPDLILPVPVTNESVTELMEVDVATNPKKRMPSGSPDGKEEESGTDDSYDGAIDGMEEEESSRPDWRMYQLVRLLHTEFKQSNFQRIIIQRLIGQGFISKMQDNNEWIYTVYIVGSRGASQLGGIF